MVVFGRFSVGLSEPLVGLVDRPQQFVERGGLFDGPGAIECRPESIKVVTGEQSDRHDAILWHENSDKLIHVSRETLLSG